MSRINEGMFSSDRPDWATPQPFYDMLALEFPFDLDAAASAANAKCERFYDETDDALTQPWDGTVWCNPPYGRTIGQWVEKGWREAQRGNLVVMLIPSRTETTYWHDYVMRADEIRFVRGRLVFGIGEATSNAPFPSCVVVFRAGAVAPRVSAIDRGRLQRRAKEAPADQASLFV